MEIIIWIPAVRSESGFSSTFVGNPDLHPESETFHHAKWNIHLTIHIIYFTFRRIHVDLMKSANRQNPNPKQIKNPIKKMFLVAN
ncbi:MAG: hypothetical protein COT43_03420 [Candidatus Marinimicrobia bacterium CG08_land_8_20_14_0_20_45_22]|nr:MAG: hypothetical protein COT43_03420 [Candidatus Marinimicrobia bacterium CG08_land_8_20_14_0_20_45_22]